MNGSPPRLDLAVERARRAVGRRLRAGHRFGRARPRRARLRPLGDQPGAPRLGHAATSSSNTRSRADLLAWAARQAGARVSASRTIAAMDDRSARRDLALVAVTVVGLSQAARAAARVGRRGGVARRDAVRDAPGPGRRGRARSGVVRRRDRVADPAVGRRGRLPRRDPARPVRAVARAGARADLAGRDPDAVARGAHHARAGRARRGRPDRRCWSRSCWSRSSASPASRRWCPAACPDRRRRSTRATCWSWPPATRWSRACSAIGPRPCA